MNHHPAVQRTPPRRPGYLLPDKPILKPQLVIRKSLLIVEMPELAPETIIRIVLHAQHAAIQTKSVLVVIVQRVAGDFDVPVGEVGGVEEGLPGLHDVVG